eukprot:6223524-Amphidinium_carterae.1
MVYNAMVYRLQDNLIDSTVSLLLWDPGHQEVNHVSRPRNLQLLAESCKQNTTPPSQASLLTPQRCANTPYNPFPQAERPLMRTDRKLEGRH